MKDYQGDFEPSYTVHLSQRAMALVRATTIFCLTLVIMAGMGLFFAFYSERFTIVGTDEGVYVFDRKDAHLNHCGSDGNCKTLNLTKSALELAAMQQPVVGQSMIGGGLMTGFQPQQAPQACPPGQPQGCLPQQPTTQAGLLGDGLVKTSPTLAVQGQMNAAQQQVNTTSIQHQAAAMQQQMLQPPVQQPGMMQTGAQPQQGQQPGGTAATIPPFTFTPQASSVTATANQNPATTQPQTGGLTSDDDSSSSSDSDEDTSSTSGSDDDSSSSGSDDSSTGDSDSSGDSGGDDSDTGDLEPGTGSLGGDSSDDQ